MSIYVDANVLVAFAIDEPFTARARRLLLGTPEELLVSDFASLEAASAIGRVVRMRFVSAKVAHAALDSIEEWRSKFATAGDLRPADVVVAGQFLRRFDLGLCGPDALHVAAAQRHNAGLATFDERMARAAKTLGVRVVKV